MNIPNINLFKQYNKNYYENLSKIKSNDYEYYCKIKSDYNLKIKPIIEEEICKGNNRVTFEYSVYDFELINHFIKKDLPKEYKVNYVSDHYNDCNYDNPDLIIRHKNFVGFGLVKFQILNNEKIKKIENEYLKTTQLNQNDNYVKTTQLNQNDNMRYFYDNYFE